MTMVAIIEKMKAKRFTRWERGAVTFFDVSVLVLGTL